MRAPATTGDPRGEEILPAEQLGPEIGADASNRLILEESAAE